ncbi:hypothetical protein [Maribacter litoralis]|uniref:hypothetical protein n=1 Tax=Maribacter litoralis TaxID=2059726 RepID=UPI003D279C32
MKRNNENLQYYSALGFYKQGKKSAKKFNKNIGNENFELVSVSTVCYSFSTELLLKLLIQIISKKAIDSEHKLEKLFNKLPAEFKAEIEEIYQQKKKLENKKLKPIKVSFNSNFGNKENIKNENNITDLSITELLKIHNESFVKWRYLYEIKGNEHYYFEFNFKLMDDFINSVIEVIEGKIK